MKHEKCMVAKGMKLFSCNICGNNSNNYINGIDICTDCCEKISICQICGKPIKQTVVTEGMKTR